MVDRLYNTAKAGELLGGLNPGDVRALVKRGELHAKTIVVRGRGGRPRLYFTASELARFIRELKSPEEVRASAEKKDGRKNRLRSPHKGELERATNYY